MRTRLKILKRNIFDIYIHAIYFPVAVTGTRIALFRDYAVNFPALFQPSFIRERTNGINFALCADPESGSGGFCELRAKETRLTLPAIFRVMSRKREIYARNVTGISGVRAIFGRRSAKLHVFTVNYAKVWTIPSGRTSQRDSDVPRELCRSESREREWRKVRLPRHIGTQFSASLEQILSKCQFVVHIQ